MRIPLNPGSIAFPIYWFPVVVPLCLSVLGMLGDGSWDLLSLLKNIHLSYVSTDIWALTTFTFAGASRRLEGWRTWSYTLATVIGLLFHMLAYLFVAAVKSGTAGVWIKSSTAGTWIALVLFLIGTYGMLAIRSVVFDRIEVRDLEGLS
jgi:hypothetical protein